ncbi:hypothetical protein [Nonlabens dokdonensis]|uniref:hypothetical protein n=1 Tax=Nonlabens dokdonensis TaxID=328515 RepID=UPI00145E529D|nr:hypothetical protein [Nonlabens dokdonensis]
MKTKICATCNKEDTVMYRVQITAGKKWIFCCKSCTEKHQSLPNYKYGGTWKGKRH